MQTFNPKTKHSREYYAAVLKIIASSLEAGHNRSQIRALLSASGTPTPTGMTEWTEPVLNGILARLRAETGHFYRAALSLFYNGQMSKQHLQLLFRKL